MYSIIAILLGYLIGSIPFSLIIGKCFFKKDIREEGSKNLGASNAGRVLGKKIGALIIVLDQLKAAIAVLIMYFIVKNMGFSPIHLYITGIASLIGHCYPIFASFRGGKAVDCVFGFLLIINIYLYIIALLIFLLTIKLTKIISLSSLTSFTAISFISFIPFFHYSPFLNYSLNSLFPYVIVLMTLFVIYRHTPNIKRMINKKETKITWLK